MKYIIISVLLMVNTLSFAQKMLIPDVKFREYLQNVYPYLMQGDSMLLNQTHRVVGAFNVQGLGIQNLEGIQYFTQLTSMNISYNLLKELPQGVNNLRKLQSIVAVNNQLTVCPNFYDFPQLRILHLSFNQLSTIEKFATLPNLEELYLDNNDLLVLSDNMNTFLKLKILVLNDNQLTKLPYLRSLKLLTIFSIYNNKLSFQQLEPIASFLEPSVLQNYTFPQAEIELIKTINVQEGNSLKISVPTNSTNSVYKWYFNEQFLKTTNQNELVIEETSLSTQGIYYCQIENTLPVFENNYIKTSRVAVDIDTCMKYKHFEYNLLSSPTCLSEGKLQVNFEHFSSIYDVVYVLKNTTTQQEISQKSALFSIKKGGNYTLKLLANDGKCVRNIQETFWVQEVDCPVYKTDLLQFSPNNDGDQDEILINYQGTIKIYNREGVLVRNMNVPNYWDGLDNNHRELTTGLYFIYINDDVLLEVTLIR